VKRSAKKLEVKAIGVAYGAVVALEDVSLEVAPGELVALLGANGAGKTTTLRVISGLMQPFRGSISYGGEDTDHLPTYEIVNRGIAMVPEGRRVFAHSSVLENLQLGAYTHRAPKTLALNLERVLTLFPRLAERQDQLAGSLSGGEQQMLAIGRALMSEPQLLLLDEPSMGLAPKIVDDIFSLILDLNRQGTTILLVEQNANLSLEIANRAYVLEGGRIAVSGFASEIADDPKIVEAYLGGGAT
jgi:branched-chain amino acid transport system ATP-binding protein